MPNHPSLAIIAVAFFGACTPSADVTGTLTDVVTGSSIAGAAVKVSGVESAALTSAEGSFTIPGLPPGVYTATVAPEGYTDAESTFSVGEDGHFEPLALEVALRPPGYGLYALVDGELTKLNTVEWDAWWGGYKGTEGKSAKDYPAVPATVRFLVYDSKAVTADSYELIAGLKRKSARHANSKLECDGDRQTPNVKKLADELYIVEPDGLSTGGHCLWMPSVRKSYLVNVVPTEGPETEPPAH